jgi:hypothetical protein
MVGCGQLASLWITRGQDAAAVALDDEVLDDDEFDVLDDDFALESDDEDDEADDEDEAGVDVEPPSDAAAPALALPSELSDLLSVR